MSSVLEFPTSVGPFTMASCRVSNAMNAFYRMHMFPRPHPDNDEPSMAGIDPHACGLPQGEILFCQLSPLHAITLDDETKAAANIPQASKFFAWSYPVVDDGTIGAGTSAEHLFLQFGGYVYFSQPGETAESIQCVGSNSIIPAPLGTLGLMFGRAQELEGSVEEKLWAQGRFQEVTLPPLLAGGATHFAWIRPGEFGDKIASDDGAFSYKFRSATSKYYPVTTEQVFTPELLEEDLDSTEAWVVVRPDHPVVEKISMFDKTKSFNENMLQNGISDLVNVPDTDVLASRGGMSEPVRYDAWQIEVDAPGTIPDPWILTLRRGWDLDSQLLGNDAVETS